MGSEMCIRDSSASERLYHYLSTEQFKDDNGNKLPTPGYCHFPDKPGYREVNENTGEVTSEFFKQLTAEVEVKAKRHGKVVTIYEKMAGLNNEKHDCRRMANCGLEVLLFEGHSLEPYIPAVIAEPSTDDGAELDAEDFTFLNADRSPEISADDFRFFS